MSYDITYWETLKLENLICPMDAFSVLKSEIELDFGCFSIYISEDGEISGTFSGDVAVIKTLKLRASGSGRAYEKLLNFLRQTKGELEAFFVWEGGDEMTLLKTVDGIVDIEAVNILELLRENVELKAKLAQQLNSN